MMGLSDGLEQGRDVGTRGSEVRWVSAVSPPHPSASEQYCAELKRQLEHANHVTSELTQQLSSAQSELADMREKLRQFEEEGRGRTRPQKRTKRGNRFLVSCKPTGVISCHF